MEETKEIIDVEYEELLSDMPRDINTITTEILLYKNQAGEAILEIGKRLIEVKAQLDHGEWLDYLKERVDVSVRTAQTMMQLAKEYSSNAQTFALLGSQKALKLLTLPAAEREEFVAQNDVADMSVRQLDEAIKAQKAAEKEQFSKKLILDVQKYVEKGASKEKIGLRGPMPPGVLFAVYDSQTGNPDYIPPEYIDIPDLLDELVKYVNTTDDHPLIIAAVVHYQLVTIHPFEDGNGRTARLLSGYILDINGYGFNGIGSLEEYFAYDIDEYYESIQMGLPALYYSGRDNPPHPEIWINYFLRMVLLYSSKVCELSESSNGEELEGNLSYLKGKERELLLLLMKNYKREFTPIEVSKELKVTNKTVINRLATLVKNGFVVPNMVKERIRSYELSDFTRQNEKKIRKLLE